MTCRKEVEEALRDAFVGKTLTKVIAQNGRFIHGDSFIVDTVRLDPKGKVEVWCMARRLADVVVFEEIYEAVMLADEGRLCLNEDKRGLVVEYTLRKEEGDE